MLKKIISFVLSWTLITSQPIFAQGVAQINLGNYLRTVGSSMAMDKFRPLHMRYFSYDAATDNFQLLLDKGDNKDIKEAELEEKTKVLMEYFKIGLALPNEKFWVNLRPDAQDQIIDPELEKTDMGKIMLEADLQLKKDTAGLTSPQNPEGKAYWDKLYKKAGELFGSENITIPTITRPWIVPGEIILRQGEDSAYIFKANMKVMLEHDYLVSRGGSRTAPTYQQYAFSDPRMKELNEYSSQLIRELIIPRLTKEVNSSKRYASLRQVFFSLVMARWFKDTFGSSGSSSAPGARAPDSSYIKLIDSGELTNLTSKESWSKTYYFNEYKKSFEKGEYNLKEQVNTPTGQVIRSYVSGGMNLENIGKATDRYKGNGEKGSVETAALLGTAIAGLIIVAGAFIGIAIITVITELSPTTLRSVPPELTTSIQQELQQVKVDYYRMLEFLKDKIGEPIAISDWDKRGKEFYLDNKKNKKITVTEKFKFPNDVFVNKCYYRTDANVVVPGYLVFIGNGITATFFKDEKVGIQGSSEKVDTEPERKEIIKILQNMFEENREALPPPTIGKPKGSSPLSLEDVKGDLLKFLGSQKGYLTGLKSTLPTFLGKNESLLFPLIDEQIEIISDAIKQVSDIISLDSLKKFINSFSPAFKRQRQAWIDISSAYYNEYTKRPHGDPEELLKRQSLWQNPTSISPIQDVLYFIDNQLAFDELRTWINTQRTGSSSMAEKATISTDKKAPAALNDNVGGIDFRTMNYLVQPMGSFKDLRFGLPTLSSSALEKINLDEELEKLRDMVKNGMVPSGMRVKEYLAACFQKGKIEEKQDDLLVCLAEIYRLAEEENLETSPELRESLVIVDTGKFVLLPNNQMAGLN